MFVVEETIAGSPWCKLCRDGDWKRRRKLLARVSCNVGKKEKKKGEKKKKAFKCVAVFKVTIKVTVRAHVFSEFSLSVSVS